MEWCQNNSNSFCCRFSTWTILSFMTISGQENYNKSHSQTNSYFFSISEFYIQKKTAEFQLFSQWITTKQNYVVGFQSRCGKGQCHFLFLFFSWCALGCFSESYALWNYWCDDRQASALTCSQVPGTSVYLGQRPKNASTGTPQISPAVPGHPGWRGHPAVPVPQGTAGTRCSPCSLISRYAGTGEGSRSTPDANRSWGAGSWSAAGWAGTADTPPGVHPAAAPGWTRTGKGRQWSRCWPRPHKPLWQCWSFPPLLQLANLILLLPLLQKLLIFQHLLLWGWCPEKSIKSITYKSNHAFQRQCTYCLCCHWVHVQFIVAWQHHF